MKITLAQLNLNVGDFEFNLQKILNAVSSAEKSGSDLIVFSELAVCGPNPGDLLHYTSFLESCKVSLNEIRSQSSKIGIIIGAPSARIENGIRNIYNSAYFFYEEQTLSITDQSQVRDRKESSNSCSFTSGSGPSYIFFKGRNLLISIGIDHRIVGKHLDDKIEISIPLEINIDAQPFNYLSCGEIEKFHFLNKKHPTLYCRAVGGYTDILLPGGSFILNESGHCLKRLPLFQESVELWQSEGKSAFVQDLSLTFNDFSSENLDANLHIDKIHDALIFGIREYFRKSGFKNAILGSSGGLDSAVVLALACAALGSEHVEAILMPSPFSTAHSVDDAVELSKNLDNPYEILAIQNIYETTIETLQPFFRDLPFDVAEENLQARIRCLLLMGISNKKGSILLNTSNKSESAVGYGTLYGDTAGGISVLGDVYKSQVYALARYINRDKELIPNHILTKPPSAELRPGQVDADSLPDYDLLDALLFQHIEQYKGIKEIVAQGYEISLIERVINMVNRSEYKRNQLCPSLRVSPVPFGSGRRVPIINRFF